MLDRARTLSIFSAPRARAAEHLIATAEELVTALGSMQADLTPAQTALDAAKALYAARAYAQAASQAKVANALASSLNERFSAYMAAWKTLMGCLVDLESLGFPTASLEADLAAADKETVHQVEEGGTLVPNYLGATALLERAAERARDLLLLASRASREIFLATLATQSLSDSFTGQSPSWLVVHLEGKLERATRELALGNASGALKIASETRIQADDALAGAARVEELLEMTSAILDGLGAEGPLADGLSEKLGAARVAFEQGFLDWTTASVVTHQLSDDVAAFAKRYPAARRSLDRAEQAYAGLQREGFSSYEVESSLTEARHALGAGDWTTVRDKVHHASRTVVRLRGEQEALRRSLEDLDERVSLLDGFRLPLLPDVKEIVGRAKEEVRSGRLSGAREDLVLASSLLQEATRSGS